MTERVVLICPGRGSYSESELGSLMRNPAPTEARRALDGVLHRVDEARAAAGDLRIREMDAAPRFSARFLRGENASPLIFACTAADLARLDPQKARVVAVTGNSMGWYSALFAGGALGLEPTFRLIELMGGSQRDGVIGGQLIYPRVDPESWRSSPRADAAVEEALGAAHAAGLDAGVSIRLGGFAVLWGSEEGLRLLLERLPEVQFGGRAYPFRLHGHAAFHSRLLRAVSERALDATVELPWSPPRVPMIDGRGHQWRPLTTDPEALQRYTLGHQVTERFDFSAALRVALRDYAPDRLVLLGPGETLGGAVAHVLISERWQGIASRQDFLDRQADDPFLISLVRPRQARLVTLDGT
jgi:acyl transferase domain-containing protein